MTELLERIGPHLDRLLTAYSRMSAYEQEGSHNGMRAAATEMRLAVEHLDSLTKQVAAAVNRLDLSEELRASIKGPEEGA